MEWREIDEMPGWEDRCCLCGRNVISYNNPDPVRDGEHSCCDSCNHRIVIRARRQMYTYPQHEQAAFVARLQRLTYRQLLAETAEH